MEPDLALNFRAQAWMHYCVCRGCGELFDTGLVQDRMRERARANGAKVGPRKFCILCVMKVIANWKDDNAK